jgi:hypothetical protein
VRPNFKTISQLEAARLVQNHRVGGRKQMAIPGRIIWRDHRGTPRFTTVVTRNVGDQGVFVECLSGSPIPVHRLVYLQLDRSMRGFEYLPDALKQGKVLSAVYRVGAVSPTTGLPDGYALRLLVEPARAVLATQRFADRTLVALPA